MPLHLHLELWSLLMTCLEVFGVTSTSPGKAGGVWIPLETPYLNSSETPLNEKDVKLQRYQDFKKGILFGSLVLVYSSLKNDPCRLCKLTYYPNSKKTPEGQIDLLTTSSDPSFRDMVQGFSAMSAPFHDRAYRAITWFYRCDNYDYESRVIFSDYKYCTIIRTEGYKNLCELFTGGRHDSDRVNSWCFFIYTVFCGKPAVTFKNLEECWGAPDKTML
uniref:Putative secreted histamine binding protein of 21.3 kDa n=1 Tax=Ixodes ricinus TaxID=34613 RepID=V5ICI5_IXORI